MSFFGSKLFGYGTSKSSTDSDGPSSLTGVETIERLCDRLQSSLLIEDRHDALKTIKSLSKKYKLEVGTQAMHVLIDVIRQNTTDPELISLSLDTLSNIMNPSECDTGSHLPADLCTQFTEMFIKDQANLTLLFDLLDEFEFQVRWSSVKLINQLVLNQSEQLQEKVLQIPRGVSRLIDLLNDSREIIRNDAILILNNLTQTNANIQKIIAFESGFDRVMEIIEGEGSVLDGGVIVEDCFNLLLNLLQKNYSNQSFFKEANYIKKICKYFELSGSDDAATNWTQQKTTNLSLLLRLIQCLVAPNNQQQIINDCQRVYNHFGLLHRLCVLLTWPGVPADLLSQAICTVGEVIRGNAANQQLFSSVMMQSTPPRPIITILLLSMINEKQPFHLRSSILYSFECFLYKNEEKKAQVIDTLLPKETSNLSDINTGQILCTGLFAPNDFVSNWLCAVALAHTISNSNTLKEQLLRVQLAINSHDKIQAVSLLQQCMNILSESSNNSINYQFQSKISIIMLISTWLSNCPAAVTAFLSNEQNIPYVKKIKIGDVTMQFAQSKSTIELISQASATDTEEKSLIMQGVSSFCLGLSMLYNSEQIEAFSIDKLKDIVIKRIGIEQFEQKLEYISQHEAYTKTLKQPKFAFISVKPNDLLFDYEFTRLYKSNETLIINLLKNKKREERRDSNASSDSRVSSDHHNSLILNQYKQLIREQDTKLKEQQQLNQTLTKTCSQLQLSIQELMAKSGSNSPSEKLQYETRINQLEVKCNLLEEKCTEQEDDLCKLQREKGVLEETINNLNTMDKSTEVFELRSQNCELRRELAQINQDQENLLTLLQEMEVKLNNYKHLLKEHGEKVSEDEEEAEPKNNESCESSEKDGALPNSIHLATDSKNTSSSDSHLVLNNNFMNGSQDNSVSSCDQGKAESELLTVRTGQNVDLVTSDSKPFNFLQYFSNPVQSDQFDGNQKQPGNELDLM